MLEAGLSVNELRQLGYSASELRPWPAVDDDRVGHSDEAIGVWSLAFYLTVFVSNDMLALQHDRVP